MRNVDHPRAYDLDWCYDCGDDAGELDGVEGERPTREILFLVGMSVSLVLIF